MGNYPDDIRLYDGDYRSPYYDSSFDDAVEEKKDQLYSLIREDIINNKGININEILLSHIDCVFDYTEWIVEQMSEVSDEMNAICDLIIYGIDDDVAMSCLLSRLINSVNSDLVSNLQESHID